MKRRCTKMPDAVATLRRAVERLTAPLLRIPGGALMWANVKEAASSLLAVRSRSILALVGVVIGIGSVIAMVSTGEIVKEESLKQFRALGTNVITIRKEYAPPNAEIALADAQALPAAVPGIAIAAPWMQDYAQFAYRGKSLEQGQLLGVTEAFATVQKVALAEGRFISDLDYRQRFCVLGSEVAAKMRAAGAGRLVGNEIRIGEQLHTVIGVLKPQASGRQGANIDAAALVPSSTSARLGLAISHIMARMRPGADHVAVVRQTEAYFKRVAPLVQVQATSAKQLIAQLQRQSRLFTVLLAAVGSISLVVGGIGVMNVMLMSVTERRAEIGLRRALGARRRDVTAQFVTESVALCLIGGLLGILLGIVTAYLMSRAFGWSFFVSTLSMVLGVGVSTGVGVFFGLYPALQASRLDPIAALRA